MTNPRIYSAPMGCEINSSNEYHLKVYENRSELISSNGTVMEFKEGPNNEITKVRYKKITDALKNGYLRDQIHMCRENPGKIKLNNLNSIYKEHLDRLVSAVTSEVGRALIGLSILQITVKSIELSQSIRLHKGSSGKGFGWEEGISMRTLDKMYITPTLREEGLLKLNADGFMMTRSLAENYPYTGVYKAAIRGARADWLALVEGLENGDANPQICLHYLLSQLLNHATQFEELAKKAVNQLTTAIDLGNFRTIFSVISFIKKHMRESTYAARIMEIAMHALMQSLQEIGALGPLELNALSQMRSANKKHGNIGDIELMSDGKIVESWDAKYGKSYLRDELEELNDKILEHDNVQEAGFVSSDPPQIDDEVKNRVSEIEELHGIRVHILDLDEWVKIQFNRAVGLASEDQIARKWITAYTESLALKRPRQAPIDEPCYQWLLSLVTIQSSIPQK